MLQVRRDLLRTFRQKLMVCSAIGGANPVHHLKSDICATAGCFAYGSGAGPHALTSIAGTYNGVVNPTFAYDANGVMTSGAGRTVTATSFNMAASIVDGSNTAALAYDADHARYRMVTTGQNAGTTYYLNDPSSGAMEEKSVVGGVTTWHDYILVEGRMVAERFCAGVAPCASSRATLNYFVLDHLGSITVITDGAGNVLQRLSYDAWGKRRNADGTALNCTSGLASPSGVNRGFTGQEMIDGVCLINFNARIYDPSIGRFMSADPIAGDETVPQELNRFSFVLNDPLSLTDPSGLCGFWCVFKDVLAIAVAIVFIEVPEVDAWINVELGFTGIGAALAGPTVIQLVDVGIAGGLSGLIASGGSLKGAALGALEADLFAVAGNFLQANNGQLLGLPHVPSEFIVHGLVGGLVSEIGQGNFASGFLSAGVGSLAPTPKDGESIETTAEKTVEAAVLGGAGSVLGGGKFQNGAITGAFGYLYNDLAHAWAGTQATYALADFLNQRDGGTWIVNRGTFWDIILNGRADLVSEDGETYEVKTFTCLNNIACRAAAADQLDKYVNGSQGRLTIGTDVTLFRGLAAISAFGGVWGVNIEYSFQPSGAQGLVGYSIWEPDSMVSQIWEAFRQRHASPTPAAPFAVPSPAFP
jgi:RHS repeat-associated protein